MTTNKRGPAIAPALAFWAQSWLAGYLVAPDFGSAWIFVSLCAMAAMGIATSNPRRIPARESGLKAGAVPTEAEAERNANRQMARTIR